MADSFLGGLTYSTRSDKTKAGVLARAKEARAAREAQGGPAGTAARSAAGLALTRAARRLLALARVRVALLGEWAVPPGPLGAGALVSLVGRFLRFARRVPASHFGPLCELSRALLASMDRTDGGPTYAHALLCERLAPLCAAQLPHLLAALAGALAGACALLEASAGPRDPGAPSVLQSWGVLVRLSLVLTEPAKWAAAKERPGPAWAAAQAQLVDGALQALSASGLLPRAASALVAAFEPAPLSSPVLLSALLLAARPLCADRPAVGRAQASAFVCHVLSIPALFERLGAAPLGLRRRVLEASALALCAACEDGEGGGEAAAEALAAALDGAGALGLLANGCSLGSGLMASAPPARLCALLAGTDAPGAPAAGGGGVSGARSSWALCLCASLHRLATFQAGSAAGGSQPSAARAYEPLLGCWVVGFDAGPCVPHAALLARQLRAGCAPALLELLWGPAMAAPLVPGRRGGGGAPPPPPAPPSAEACARALGGCAGACRFCLLWCGCLPAQRTELLASAAFASLLLSRLWACLLPLLPGLTELTAHAVAAAAGGAPPAALAGSAGLRAAELFARAMCALLPTLDESELDGAPLDDEGGALRFCRAELSEMARLANRLAWACVERAPVGGASTAELPPPLCGAEPCARAAAALAEPLLSLVALLRERHVRAPLGDDAHWQLPGAQAAAVAAEGGCAPSLARLCRMPWAADFCARVRVFRALVAADKLAVRGGDGSAARPRTAPELAISVRRGQLLRDGYAQLAHQPPAALRRVLRVRFVSALGLAEAGIDHNGVFKEFMEESLRAALHADLGLFSSTPPSGARGVVSYYPNPHSALLHEDDAQLLQFVGAMLGKALYEGVTLDVPLAPFFVRRVLGGASSLDELPELDLQLHASLLFVRAAAPADVAELCLTFAVDVEALGAQRTVELRPGGAALPVDGSNRIQYVHLVADYHLNRKIGPQAAALRRGLTGVLQPRWLRLFSARELGTLLAGADVEVDVDDLRRHTSYHGGYHELSPTVRALWAVLREFSNGQRKAFLKFVTSCSQPPLLGFRHLEPRFAVQCVAPGGADSSPLGGLLAMVGLTPAERQRLPTAATCFNLLKLPDFRSKRLLREKLLVAIQSNSGFELS